MSASKPSPDNRDRVFRSNVSKKLRLLAEVLEKHQIVMDVNPLRKAADYCIRYNSQGNWGYEVSSLIFHQLQGLRLFPNGAQTPQLRLDMRIQGPCSVRDNTDPLSLVDMEIEIYSTINSDNQENIIKHCWHFDRQIEGGNVPEFSHPSYHFQFGGNRLENHLRDKPSHILLLESPRLAHPPMDAILGVDFVIANFVGRNIAHDCVEDVTYQSLIKEAQKQLWKPYLYNLHGVWQPNSHLLPWKPSSIWPQIIL